MAKLLDREATIRTASVSIQALTVDGKQVTMGLFRQLEQEHPISDTGALIPEATLWGRVNYWPSPCDSDHLHVVWQKGIELRRSCVRDYRYEASEERVNIKNLKEIRGELAKALAYQAMLNGTAKVLETAAGKIVFGYLTSDRFKIDTGHNWTVWVDGDTATKVALFGPSDELSGYYTKNYRETIEAYIKSDWEKAGYTIPLPPIDEIAVRLNTVYQEQKEAEQTHATNQETFKKSLAACNDLPQLFIAV